MNLTTEQKEEMFQKLDKWLRKLIPGEDRDKFDLRAEMDPALTYDENKTQIREKLKMFVKTLKEKVAEVKAHEERRLAEEIKKAEAEVEQYNTQLVTTQNSDSLNKVYQPIIKAVNKVAQGYGNIVFIKGRGGLGKSVQVRRALLNSGLKFPEDVAEVCGEVTAAYLYRLLYENNGKIVWLKDSNKILNSVDALNLLKSATETEDNRVLTKSNYSKQQSDLPNSFVCRCKLIFDYNSNFNNGALKDDFEALTTRGDYIEMQLSDDDIKAVMRDIAKEPWQKEVTEHIIRNFESNGLVRLNLRTQWKAFRTYQYALANELDWKSEIDSEMHNNSKIRSVLYSLIGNKAVKTTELKKLMLRQEVVNSLTSANRKIQEYLFLEELFKWSEHDRDFYVCINPKPQETLPILEKGKLGGI
jgi:ribosomal protein L17